MQQIRFSASLVASFLLTFASGLALAEETEYALKVDALAPLTTYWSSIIVEARAERDGWSVFVAPELIVRDYEYRPGGWGGPIGEVEREVSAGGVGVWTGVGFRPWRHDRTRAFRSGLGLRARQVDADIASYDRIWVFNGRYDSLNTVVSKREEVTRSVGIFAEVAVTVQPFGGSDFLRKTTIEPYARLGFLSDWITTTAHEGGDRFPGRSTSQEWSKDLRLGLFVGRVF